MNQNTTQKPAPSTWAAKGEKLKDEQNYAAALEAFASARLLLLAEMGDCLSNLGRPAEAAVLYEELLDFNPKDSRANMGLGVAKLVAGNPGAAIAPFTAALDTDPSDSKALCGLGMALCGAGRMAEGFQRLAQSLDFDPENLTALHEMIKTAYALNRTAEAADRLATYLMYHPADLDMLFSQAGLLFSAGKRAEAAEQLERLLILSPDYPGATEFMAKLHSMPAGNGTTAKQAVPPPADREADRTAEARKLKGEGRYAEALEEFSRLAAAGDLTVQAEIGDCLAQVGRLDEAQSAYQQAVDRNDQDLAALVGLGVISLIQEKPVKAVTWLNRALKQDPQNGKALTALGMVRNMQDKPKEAAELFDRALEVDPDNLNAVHGLVRAAYAMGSFAGAEQRLSTYLMYHPADLDMLFSLAGILLKGGKPEQALETIDKVLIFEPGYQGGMELRNAIVAAKGE